MNDLYRAILYLGFLITAIFSSPTSEGNSDVSYNLEKSTVRDDVILDLRVPYDKILYGEIPHIYLGIKNLGNKPLNINTDLMFDTCNQMIFEARGGDSTKNLTQPEYIPTWDRLNQGTVSKKYTFDTINQGDYRIFATYQKPRSQLSFNYDILPEGTKQMRCSLLTGPNEWTFSNWVEIERLNDRKLQEAETITELQVNQSKNRLIKKAIIDGETYLFWVNPNNGTRIARLPEGAKPRFEIFGEGLDRKLIIHFEGVNVSPVVHRIASIETLEGSPDTTPHLEVLKALRKDMANGTLNTPHGIAEQTLDNPPSLEKVPENHKNVEEPTTSSSWPLIIIGLIFFAIITLIGYKVLGRSS